MTPRHTFYRKLAYFVAIVLLLYPLSWISEPASGGSQQRAGGKLAQLRKENGLAQANLGDIDPTSEAMKLATIGARGLAANVLWHKANHYKKTEDWTNLSATLNQITKLQPNFLRVWQFQAWNLSYNVSVQFDDYRDRYAWVIRGVNFLKQGLIYNAEEPRILWDLGWFIGHKIGRADEKVEYRRLFKQDDDFHAAEEKPRNKNDRDNWLVGRDKFLDTIRAVVIEGKRMRGKSELLYHSDPAMAQIYYAIALLEDGDFSDDGAKKAWVDASDYWKEYGDEDVLTSQGRRIQLSKLEFWQERQEDLRNQIDALAPGTLEAMQEERERSLTLSESEARATPPELRTMEQHQLAEGAEEKLRITNLELAARVADERPESETEAMRLARRADEAADRSGLISRYRAIVNYDYWKRRCEFEQTDLALEAHRHVYEGEQAFERMHLEAARQNYEIGFQKWREVYDQFPDLDLDDLTAEDLAVEVRKYVRVLDQFGELLPADFPLRAVLEAHDPNEEFAALFAAEDASQDTLDDDPPAVDSESNDAEPENSPQPDRPAAPEPAAN